tara:strand:- start:239 stop:1195 length:957 start_codon:yes stop_codon:yes gene_type:complete
MSEINIIARTNGVGLDQDVDLIYRALSNAGHKVSISHSRSISVLSGLFPKKNKYDANIFLERVFPRWIKKADKNFLIPNQERFPYRQLNHLKKIDYVLCKSKHSLDIFSQYAKSQLINFSSVDRVLDDVKMNYKSCFHLAGKSTLKGTKTILDLWSKHPDWPLLTLIQCEKNAPKYVPDNVRLITKYLTTEELRNEMNQHGVHLCTSQSEGWGHYIVEAMSCSALVVTTDAPPMNEIIGPDRGMLVPFENEESRHLGYNFYVNPSALAKLINKIFLMPDSEIIEYGHKARDWFEKNQTRFVECFPKVIQLLIKHDECQ